MKNLSMNIFRHWFCWCNYSNTAFKFTNRLICSLTDPFISFSLWFYPNTSEEVNMAASAELCSFCSILWLVSFQLFTQLITPFLFACGSLDKGRHLWLFPCLFPLWASACVCVSANARMLFSVRTLLASFVWMIVTHSATWMNTQTHRGNYCFTVTTACNHSTPGGCVCWCLSLLATLNLSHQNW